MAIEIQTNTVYKVRPAEWSQSSRLPTIEVKDGVVDVYVSLDEEATQTSEMSLELQDFGQSGNEIQFLQGDPSVLYCQLVSGTPRVFTTFVED